MKTAAYIVGGIAALAVLYVALFGLSFLNIRVGGILRAEQVRVEREVYEESLSFNRGVSSNFERQRVALETARNEGSRSAVCASIVRQFAPDVERLSPDQQAYYRRLQASGCR
ncbi:hypothetical protein [Oceanicaulis sp.]|uniref:hypothetical protein n=1 Tax=Oceanicaulis sp. TaxID=1924941 RepID=UPI003D2665DB